MRVVLLGPPGAGKGTQAQVVARHLGVPAISTGDVFRDHVSGGTELGRRARACMDAGDLVPDELTVAMVRDRLASPDAGEGFVLDGFPRTVPQAEHLRALLAETDLALTSVVELLVDTQELVRRLSTRVVLVDGRPSRREDDDPDTVRHRLTVHETQTRPVSEWYAAQGLLTRVVAGGPVDEVTSDVVAVLEAVRTEGAVGR